MAKQSVHSEGSLAPIYSEASCQTEWLEDVTVEEKEQKGNITLGLEDLQKEKDELKKENEGLTKQLENQGKYMQELASENASLRDDNEQLHKTLQVMQGALDEYNKSPRRKEKTTN